MPGAVVTVEASLFAVTVVAWFLLELRRALHRRTDAATEGDRSSLALLRVTTPLGFLLAVLVALVVPAAAVPAWLADGIALLLLWCGIAIRWWSIRALGDYFTYTVQTSSDQRVVDTELTTLLVDALLRRAGALVDLARVAGVGVHQDELADVVQERGDHQAVAVLVAGLGGETVGSALRGDAVQAEALRSGVPDGRALEEVIGARAGGERLDGLGREELDGLDDALDATARAALDLVGEAERGDDERDVGLDGADDLADGDALLADEAEQTIARLGESREGLERLERRRQPAAVALVMAALSTGLRRGRGRLRGVGGGIGRGHP